LHEWLLSSLSWLHIAPAAKVRFLPILLKNNVLLMQKVAI